MCRWHCVESMICAEDKVDGNATKQHIFHIRTDDDNIITRHIGSGLGGFNLQLYRKCNLAALFRLQPQKTTRRFCNDMRKKCRVIGCECVDMCRLTPRFISHVHRLNSRISRRRSNKLQKYAVGLICGAWFHRYHLKLARRIHYHLILRSF